MFSNWTVGRRLLAGFGLAAVTLALIAIVSYRNTHDLIENDALVAHSHLVRVQLADLTSLLKDTETGQRGYVITGDDAYLAPYQTALAKIHPALDDLRKLTADNANQLRRFAAIAPPIDAKLAELKQTIDLRKDESKGFEAALAAIEMVSLRRKLLEGGGA